MVMLKRKKKSMSVPARIVSTNENKLVVELDIDKAKYKKGQMVVATVSAKEKTLGGKPVVVSDVVAQGPIEDITGKCVTICTRKRNPIVSQRAAVDAKQHAKTVSVRVVE
jgi:hypothetical protein